MNIRSILGNCLIDIAGGILRLGPRFLNGEALSLKIGSKRIFKPSIFRRIVAWPIQVK